jgi:hypothetical protein
LGTEFSDAGTDIFNIERGVSNDLSLADSWTRFGEVVETVVVLLAHAEQTGGSIDLLAKIDVVNFVDIALVHISPKD